MSDFHSDPATLAVARERPLLIVDADEVLLAFVAGFDRFLRERALFLDLVSYRLHGNVKRLEDRSPLIDIEVTALLDEFRSDLDSLDAVEHAREVLASLARDMAIVVLTNITPVQAPARRRNLDILGFAYPLVVNNGPKGRAVKSLASRAGKPVFFVDDIPQHLSAAAQEAPDVWRIQLIGDERLKPLMPKAPDAQFRAETWHDAETFIREHL
ncbi:MAG: hypothetical protein WBQ17_07975 [Rhizomicrobium sp.]